MRRFVQAFLGAGLVLAGVALVVLGLREVTAARARAQGETVVAVVTDLRTDTDMMRGVASEHHEVRYLFDVGGATYSPGDATGRTDLFVAIDEELWSTLSVGGPIDVAFDPQDPADNRPVGAVGGLGDAIAGMVAGLLIAAVGALVLAACRRAPQAGPEIEAVVSSDEPARS